MSNPADAVLTLPDGSLQLRFYWQDDRFQHTFALRGRNELSSNDANGIETPCYTELHEQDGILFLSGNAAIGHWSASVQAVTSERRGEDGFDFDIACRAKQPAELWGACYRGVGSGLSMRTGLDGVPGKLGSREGGHLFEAEPPATFPGTIRLRYFVGVSC